MSASDKHLPSLPPFVNRSIRTYGKFIQLPGPCDSSWYKMSKIHILEPPRKDEVCTRVYLSDGEIMFTTATPEQVLYALSKPLEFLHWF